MRTIPWKSGASAPRQGKFRIGALAPEGIMNRLIDSITSLGGLLVPICAILIGGAIAIIGMIHRHQERLAKIERGMDPDGPWQQQK
jgi:hypothetical protein